MSIERVKKSLTGDSPGTVTELNGFRIGPVGAHSKAYLQGALHTDEQPGIMTLHHLLPMLFEADSKGQLKCEFVVFPMVNPLGMGNIEFGMHQGRYDRPSGVNFNRDWPDLFEQIETEVAEKLNQDSEHNLHVVRKAVGEWLQSLKTDSVRQQLRRFVLLEAYTADYVFDLHCDDDSLLHIFSAPHCNDKMQVLSDALGGAAILTAEDSGGGSFDEVCSLLWINLKQRFPDHPISIPVAACTIELRGQGDVFDAVGHRDAMGIYTFFQQQGLIDGEPKVELQSTAKPLPLNATDLVRVDQAGLIAYKVELGQFVSKGDIIAELISLHGDDAFVSRYPIKAGTSGTVISRLHRKYVWPGCSIAKIVGTEPLASRGEYLLED
jgi:predicted deacylase